MNKVTVTPKWRVTLNHLKMHAQTKFWIPTSNNVGDMLQTRLFNKRGQGHSDQTMIRDTLSCQDASKHHIWDSYLK